MSNYGTRLLLIISPKILVMHLSIYKSFRTLVIVRVHKIINVIKLLLSLFLNVNELLCVHVGARLGLNPHVSHFGVWVSIRAFFDQLLVDGHGVIMRSFTDIGLTHFLWTTVLFFSLFQGL